MVRHVVPGDAEQIARLLHDFNLEFGEASPGAGVLAPRVREFVDSGAKSFLVGGVGLPEAPAEEAGRTGLAASGPIEGFAQVDFRPSVWFEDPVALLEELYVVPDRCGRGLGRELMDAVLELARGQGAATVEVVTGEDDTAARGLYESSGFRNRIEGEQNTRSLYCELELRTDGLPG